ncbi:ATP-binding cassette domain-containing protein [Kordiimonas sp. SCSIO 12603]|uniref:ABC transporter ATP-binding protein n=1 Tax=Kordiimonas sp. SCSIO 12603 TaxID=2829596 RepID=UPI002103B746|nr:ATP-binding cassette domain-containing protein [Kordiimonas sp. SCSIO 12603]UTW58508.1 ATP-binding cassette domain-containing protein [Kordiimonas sp. SCSIO 12603]
MDDTVQTDDVIIRVRGLVNAFDNHVVHKGLDLDVKRGEILGVVGGSGAGKSVLLRTIIGLNRQVAGQIEINDIDQNYMSADEAQLSRRHWGVLFQDGALFSALTVAQNVMAPMREHYSFSQDLLEDLASSKISMAGLPLDAANKFPADLSGGMRKRAALARSLALDPEILFLDEPTAGLDPIGAAAFDGLVKNLSKSLGLTVFLVTHDLDTLVRVCDRIAVLGDKKMLITAPLEEVQQYDHPWVQEYFGGPRARAAGIKE